MAPAKNTICLRSGQTEPKVGSMEDQDAATVTDIREFAKPSCAKGA